MRSGNEVLTPGVAAAAHMPDAAHIDEAHINDERFDDRFMRQALEAAAAGAREGEVPVGAVLVQGAQGQGGEALAAEVPGGEVIGGQVIGVKVLACEHNRPRGLCDPTAHAEILALRAAALACRNYRLPGATLYVTLEPCAMCVGAMIQARVARLVFGALDPKAGAVASLYRLAEDSRLNHRIEVCGGVLAEESAALLKGFFERLR